MAITELIFPVLKQDEATIEEAERNKDLFAKELTVPNPGLLSAFRGWVLYEHDQNVRDAQRECLILEWRNEASCTAFLRSDQFISFVGTIQHLLAGPPELQVYETNVSPEDAAAALVVEIVRVTITKPESSKTAEQAWESMSKFLTEEYEPSIAVTCGKSLNLDRCIMMGILGWPSSEERLAASMKPAVVHAFASLRSVGEVSQIIVDIDPLALPAVLHVPRQL